jgi:hypothetical protein
LIIIEVHFICEQRRARNRFRPLRLEKGLLTGLGDAAHRAQQNLDFFVFVLDFGDNFFLCLIWHQVVLALKSVVI